ncbi:CG11391, partial [Drosophila busckii]
MLDLNGNQTTSYDAVHKIWSGAIEPSFYNDDISIGQLIFRQLQRDTQRVFQISVSDNTRLSRGEMLQNAAKVGAYLQQQGFSKDTQFVGIVARNTTHLAALAYGCMFNATPFHAVNPNMEERTVLNLFSITKPKIICCDATEYELVKNVAATLAASIIILSGHVAGISNIQDVLQTQLNANYRPATVECCRNRTLAVLCSSGTTGTPKAVTISNSRKMFDSHCYLTSSDVQYAPSTLDWLTGLITLITAGVYGTVRLISKEPYSVDSFLSLCEQHEISWAVLAASHIAMLANSPNVNARQLRSLRHLLFAGGHTLVATLQKMQSHLAGEGILRNAYGLTEVGTLVSCNYCTHTKPKSVGRLAANMQVRIVDAAGKSLGPNQTGEIYCHNAEHWRGYFGNALATAEMQDSAGWFHTGDLGYFDDEHYLYIVERKKDMLKFLGMMYYPHEIEEVIARMPQVAEVCVFGIWNETEGDAAAASIVAKPGAQLRSTQVLEFVRQHISVKYKQLNAGAQVIEQLAKSANGKINRQAVKAAYLQATQK